jgi:polyisoprenoid-binding protein YceI
MGAAVFRGTTLRASLVPPVLALGLLGVACSPSSAPAVPPPPTTAASAPSAPVSVLAPGAGGDLQFEFATGGSQARYRAREQVVGVSLPNEAVGATSAVSGQIVVDTAHNVVRDASRVTVDLRSLQSDQGQRDQFIQQNPLQTGQYPTAEFVPTVVRGLSAPLPPAGALAFQLAGDLTVHGVTRPAVWEVQAQVNGGAATGTAATQVTLADFGMQKPIVGPILSIDDTITLELDFHVVRVPASPEVSLADTPRGT